MKSLILKISSIILFFNLMGTGCEKKEEDSVTVCGIENPLSNLDWLKNIKSQLKTDSDVTSAAIILYRLNNVDYILIHGTYHSVHDYPDSIIYDCKGNEKYVCGGNQQVDNCSTFLSNAQKIKTLWEK